MVSPKSIQMYYTWVSCLGFFERQLGFHVKSGSDMLVSTVREVLGGSSTGKTFPNTSQPVFTDYGTSDSEAVPHNLANEPISTSVTGVCEDEKVEIPFIPCFGTQPGLRSGRTKYYPSDNTRTFERFFSGRILNKSC